jgi:hypothetical protein
VHPSYFNGIGNTTLPALAANTFNIIWPASAITTAFGWQLGSNAENGSAGILHVGAAASHVSQLTISAVTGTDCPTCVVNNAANTGTAAMTLDMSASTSAAALRIPNLAGATSTTSGVFSYDTTNKNEHTGANGVDNFAIIMPSSITPANNDCAKFTVVGSTITLNTAGAACGAGAGANTALSNLAAVAINAALLPGVTNSIALGSASFFWSNLFSTAIQCGIAGTTSCVITGAGSTSGTATLTWPAVAGTTTNAITSSNNISAPAFVSTVAIGTAPFTVTSTTNVANLNASTLSGATFAAPGPIGSTTPSTGVFTALTCGVAGTTSCVINGAGSTSGTATITWPAVAGTTTNAIAFANAISTGTAPAVTTPGTGFYVFGTEGTEPASIAASADGFNYDSTLHCPVVWNNAVQGGCTDFNPIALTGTNIAGTDHTVFAGLGTGNATPAHLKIQSPTFSSTSGTTAQTEVTTYVVHKKAGSTTSATATNMFNVAMAANQTAGFEIIVHVETTQATPHNCSTTENFIASVQDTAATVTQQTTAGTIGTICDTGTLTLAAAFSAAAPSVFSVTPTWTTIVPTAVIITVEIHNLSQQELALL